MMRPMIEYLLTFREHAEKIGSQGEPEEWHSDTDTSDNVFETQVPTHNTQKRKSSEPVPEKQQLITPTQYL